MIRTYPEAPVCAVGAIVFRGNAVLLIRRAKPPAQGNGPSPGSGAATEKL
jgi:ADP-ribose pyrophosphatase YjhB (NUDIX family)